jgi:hypothetical protein
MKGVESSLVKSPGSYCMTCNSDYYHYSIKHIRDKKFIDNIREFREENT